MTTHARSPLPLLLVATLVAAVVAVIFARPRFMGALAAGDADGAVLWALAGAALFALPSWIPVGAEAAAKVPGLAAWRWRQRGWAALAAGVLGFETLNSAQAAPSLAPITTMVAVLGLCTAFILLRKARGISRARASCARPSGPPDSSA